MRTTPVASINDIDPLFVRAYMDWLSGKHRNLWINGEVVTAYLRKAVHVLPLTGRNVTSLDIASIEVAAPARGRGVGTAAIDYIHSTHTALITRVECIQTPRFFAGLRRRDWQVERPDELTPSVYKLVSRGT